MEQPESLVVDANIVFSALSSKSFTFQLIRLLHKRGVTLYSPQYLREELEEKTPRLLEYSGLSRDNLSLLFKVVLEQIKIAPKSEYNNFLPEAGQLIPQHQEDTPYLALALKTGCPLWSNERRLRTQQSKVKVLPTHKLKKQFGIN